MPTDPRDLRGDAPLLDAWLRFQESEPTPFTIPGHKQRTDLVGDVVAGDVPLYAGLDTMKLSAGVLADAEARAARLWGADVCRFSTGGATQANQAVALSVAGDGDTVVVSRTLHRSMLLGLVLAGLTPVWVRPDVDPATGLPMGVSVSAVRAALDAHPEAKAVFVGDPSYVGTIGDVAGLAVAAHDHDVPLVVDAAWAAHVGFHPDLPPHAMALGADVVVTSAHKTLPAWSQAALVLARTDRIDRARLDAGVEATATTSPAGAILASIDASRALLERDGERLLATAIEATRTARARLAGVPGLVVLDGPGVDPLKLTLVLSATGADGNAVERDLLDAGLPVESADRDVLIGVVTLADTAVTVGRLTDALVVSIGRHRGRPRPVVGAAAYRADPVSAMSPREAFFAASEAVPLDRVLGRVSAELVAPY
ncbi:MAG: aminotransferase class V-fold PLP-dependent enzyme, partial [Nocardioidaceae bacterium]|nr:aminotransferase class V-fold PLP-dependent enzyme [Nocardioidaceae bacterium]